MDKYRIQLHTIASQCSILEALDRLNALPSGEAMALVVTDPSGLLVGTLTDGDIRRALLRGLSLSSQVSLAMHTAFSAIPAIGDAVDTLRDMRSRGLRLIPVTDPSGALVDLIDTLHTPSRLPLSAILMAGGKGERLRPLTLTTPKPLLPVGSRAIIDHNIDLLRRAGITDISVTVNYLAEQIEAHFQGSEVKTVRELEPLGTIGAAALCDIPPSGASIVMNADLLTSISLEDMYIHHRAHAADITIAAIPYDVSIPYAILSTQGPSVIGLEEKPSYSYYANAGIYIIDNSLLRSLPAAVRTDATDLIESAIRSGRTVTFFPISGTWIDIGSPADYSRACTLTN